MTGNIRHFDKCIFQVSAHWATLWISPDKMASNCEVEVTNCLLNCAIGVQEFLKSPEKESLEFRLEKDEIKIKSFNKLEVKN